MPSIKDAIQKNAQRIAAGEQLVQPAPKDVGPASSDGPFVAPASPVVTGLPVRGAYTPNLTLHTDFQNNTQGLRTGPNIRSATFPSPQTSSSSIITKIVSAATAAVSSLVIKVNNALAPNQNLINLLNGTGMIITVDAAGNIVFNSTSSGDGLTHGSLPWEIDPSSFILQDDFFSCQLAANTSAPTAGIGQLGWRIVNTGGLSITGGYAQSVGNPLGLQGTPVGNSPAGMGCFVMSPTSTAQQGGLLMMNWSNGGYGALSSGSGAWPLIDNPGWKCTWVFKHDISHAPTATVYTPAGHSTYVGLFGPNEAFQMNGGTLTSRPGVFCGVRFDSSGYYPSTFTSYGGCTAVTMTGSSMAITGTFTGANTTSGTSWIGLTFVTSGFGDAGNNGTFICTNATTTTLTLTNANGVNATGQTGTVKSNTPCICTAVANASAGSTSYTGTFPNVGSLEGQQVTISGFGNAANNGTFTIVSQSSGTTLVVNNPSGVAETHAGYIAGLGLFDSTYVLEYVVNPSTAASSTRNNLQGQTSALAVGPAVPGVWYRLDITCASSSQITITLSGNGTTNSLVVNTAKYTQVFNGNFGLNATLVGLTGNPNYLNILELSSSDSFPFNASFPVAIGGSVTIAGLTSTGAPMNGTWPVLPSTVYGSTLNLQLGGLNHAPIGSVQQKGAGISMSAYPGFTPGAFHGCDISTPLAADSQTLWLDYFGFAWNPALGANAPGTPDPTKARYW